MDDLISRQAAIDAVSRGCQELRGVFARCEKNLNALPSAERHGRWEKKNVPTDFDGEVFNVEHIVCSVCEAAIPLNRIYKTEWYSDYCPSCGASMQGEEE